MSADNYYIIRKHPAGGFAAVMGFDSDDRQPTADIRHTPWPTVDMAADWAHRQYSEYGVSIHPECCTPRSPAPDSPSASGTPAEVDGQSSGPKPISGGLAGGAS